MVPGEMTDAVEPVHQTAGHSIVIRSRVSAYKTHTTIAREGRKEMFYLTTLSTHFIYGYMASDIW